MPAIVRARRVRGNNEYAIARIIYVYLLIIVDARCRFPGAGGALCCRQGNGPGGVGLSALVRALAELKNKPNEIGNATRLGLVHD